MTFNADDATLSSVFKTLSRLSNTNIVTAIDQAGTAEEEKGLLSILKMYLLKQPSLWLQALLVYLIG